VWKSISVWLDDEEFDEKIVVIHKRYIRPRPDLFNEYDNI